MAIIKSSVKLIIREHVNYHFSGPALSLGVPEIYATYNELKKWFPELAGRSCPLNPTDVKISTNEIGKKLGWVTADTFLRSLGISDLVTVDIPGCEHEPTFIHDLNQPFPQSYHNRFNLVIDPGTIEHVFDIKTGFSNIVGALRVGGVIIHQVPVYSYNGGYYSLNPNVLNDFYRKNGFRELKTFIIMWDRYRAYTGQNRCYEYDEALLGARHAIADYDQCRFSPHMLFMARKTEELPAIRIPMQYEGQYVEGLVKDFSKNSLGVFKIKRHIISLLDQVLPFRWAFFLKSWLKRNIQLFKTYRKSFWI